MFLYNAFAIGQPQYVRTTAEAGSFPIVQKGRAAAICVDSADWPGVIRAVHDLKSDIARVTGIDAPIADTPGSPGKFAIIVGTIGRADLLMI